MATTNTIATGVAYADPAFQSVQVGSSTVPVQLTAAGVLNGSYATTSATSGDTRLDYQKLTFSSTGSGETLRAFSVVTGTGAAAAGTINGAHISCEVQGGTISGAANALRATIGGTTASIGGTVAALQLDTNFASGASVPSSASFIRVTDSGTAGKITALMNLPAALVPAKTSASGVTHTIKLMVGSTPYYLMVSDTQ